MSIALIQIDMQNVVTKKSIFKKEKKCLFECAFGQIDMRNRHTKWHLSQISVRGGHWKEVSLRGYIDPK